MASAGGKKAVPTAVNQNVARILRQPLSAKQTEELSHHIIILWR